MKGSKRTDLSHHSVDQFLQQVKQHRPVQPGRGRLLFALDATASRQPTWDTACQLQADMFLHTKALGQLEVQLSFYRGYDELRFGQWHQGAAPLVKAMSAVHCLGGHTQIGRLLRQALKLHQQQPIQALVFIGDCIEESLDELCQLAGECGLHQLPLFLFQEGDDPIADSGFNQMARLSGGAHCRFDLTSPQKLSELLSAVAVYATAGQRALADFSERHSLNVQQLSHQLTDQRSKNRGPKA